MQLKSIGQTRLLESSDEPPGPPRLWGTCTFTDGFEGLFVYDPATGGVELRRRTGGRDYRHELCRDPQRLAELAEIAPIHYDRAVQEAQQAALKTAAWFSERAAHHLKRDAGPQLFYALKHLLAQGATDAAVQRAQAALDYALGVGAREHSIVCSVRPEPPVTITTANPKAALINFVYDKATPVQASDYVIQQVEP